VTTVINLLPCRFSKFLPLLPCAVVVALACLASGALADEPGSASATTEDDALPPGLKPPMQGPAISAPREIFNMLEQRKRFLDKREASLRGADTRLLELRAELEQIVTRHEKLVEAEKKRSQAVSEAEKAKDSKNADGPRNVHQAQLAKIYEAMPAEEAAARLERMPERKAIEVLRLLKGKSAGAILAEVKPERAARLTEQLLSHP
jgi:flagellar motility protein MotE (MotC chaperone)